MDVESYATELPDDRSSLPANGRDQNIALVDIGAHVIISRPAQQSDPFSRDQASEATSLRTRFSAPSISRRMQRSPRRRMPACPRTMTLRMLQPFMKRSLEITRAAVFLHPDLYSQVDQVACGWLRAGARTDEGCQARRRECDCRQSFRQYVCFDRIGHGSSPPMRRCC
jgi:hypothetical protein